ncbi:cytochrome P450 [Mycena rosella]|uniref:Cytochrome P450 n=1 Tax=Mycena rosella TaxID=1033263 RepID=A0AAD7GKP0_MYCRO|nr:cytochrome P450 [Mycena rosella]
MSLNMYQVFFALAVLLLVYKFFEGKSKSLNRPPIVHISHEALFRYPRQAYETALKEHGPVIGVYRKNRLEYITDESLASEVLTNDALFSAERGTAAILNMPILNMLPHSFIGSLDKLINKSVIPFMETLVPKLAPVFEKHMFELAAQAEASKSDAGVPVELAHHVHDAMAESMLMLIIGEKNPSPEFVRAAIKVAFDVAIVAGIYQNLGYWSRTFPSTWRAFIWIKLMIFTIPWTFRNIAWRVWKDLQVVRKTGKSDHLDPVCLVSRLIQDTGSLRLKDRLWIVCLTLGITFASIHQTSAVIIWVVYELGVRRENLPLLRQELVDILETDPVSGKPTLTYSSLRNAERLDSFIREVLRMKGDTLTIFRLTTKDVPLGGYIIPKNTLITPMATLLHENTDLHGEDAKKFIGDRWMGSGKTSASISTGYWPFGLGRFACPGRQLAIAEIKLMIFALIARADLSMEGNKYTVIDPLNTTAVPPRGQLLLTRLDKHIF